MQSTAKVSGLGEMARVSREGAKMRKGRKEIGPRIVMMVMIYTDKS
jgi:hypothetical protein